MEYSESDDDNHESPSAARKRSSRACDQCRKTKSKCERSATDSSQCKSCALAGTACTFLGPSYKRGPPKGYIHAIEQRWHQVESLLGAILQCPDSRVQDLVSDLRKDELAREIIGRVDSGPYGPSGRLNQPAGGATKEDFFASILRSNESGNGREPSRSRRQSRVSREKVSSIQDRGLSVVPTKEWQDNLSNRLSSSLPFSSTSTFDSSGAPLTQRRRLNSAPNGVSFSPDWNQMYTMEAPELEEQSPNQDPAEAIGALSLDEHQEVRFHGHTSGLHLLSQTVRTDDRNEGGIWRMPMARAVWPPSKDQRIHFLKEEDIEVELPPVVVQDHLIELYFTYIHPVFPVLHKRKFLTEYNARKLDNASTPSSNDSVSGTPKPEPCQKLSPLLLLSIFSITARFSDPEVPLPPKGKMWEGGSKYFESARNILLKILHRSRPTTIQSLLLLGFREFGIGSVEQGWIYIGMAIRMAMDLGLNRNSASWKIHGHDLFTPEDSQTRRLIWWTCFLADRYTSVYMGRPITIKDDDYDTSFPEIYQEEEDEPWQPVFPDTISVVYPPVPSRAISSFCATSKLFLILGAIISKIYSVRGLADVTRRAALANLETRLDHWYLSLPDDLRYDPASKRNIPPPHILFLHMRYWGTALLLHRAFIPNWKGVRVTAQDSTLEMKAFDLAQGAASHISATVTAYRDHFTLKRTSPFITSYILNAGIMHISTLTLRPSNVQASQGLRQCLTALKDMEIIWPSASRAWDLLHGAKLSFENVIPPSPTSPERPKRQAEAAFGQDRSSDLEPRSFGYLEDDHLAPPANMDGVQDLSSRIMANMLGLDIPGVAPSTSFYTSYEWWTRNNQDPSQSTSSQPASAVPDPGVANTLSSMLPYYQGRADGWLQETAPLPGYPSYPAFNPYGV